MAAYGEQRGSDLLTFSERCPSVWGIIEGIPTDLDVVIAHHASQAVHETDRWKARDRPPLFAINGRVC